MSNDVHPSLLIVERLKKKWREHAGASMTSIGIGYRRCADELEAAFRDLLLRPQEEQQTKEGQ
jgi:hypothetical protein